MFPLFSAEAAPPLRSGFASAENSNIDKNKLIFKDLKDFFNSFIKMSFGANIVIQKYVTQQKVWIIGNIFLSSLRITRFCTTRIACSITDLSACRQKNLISRTHTLTKRNCQSSFLMKIFSFLAKPYLMTCTIQRVRSSTRKVYISYTRKV